MRDEDDAFAKIIETEFNERWSPPQPAPPTPAPLPDFELNLYDDDEDYRAVPASTWSLSSGALAGLGLLGAGLAITLAKVFAWNLPGWFGWAGVSCLVGGTAVSLWHLTHRPASDDDDEGTV